MTVPLLLVALLRIGIAKLVPPAALLLLLGVKPLLLGAGTLAKLLVGLTRYPLPLGMGPLGGVTKPVVGV